MTQTLISTNDIAVAQMIAARDAIRNGQILDGLRLLDQSISFVKRDNQQQIDEQVTLLIGGADGL